MRGDTCNGKSFVIIQKTQTSKENFMIKKIFSLLLAVGLMTAGVMIAGASKSFQERMVEFEGIYAGRKYTSKFLPESGPYIYRINEENATLYMYRGWEEEVIIPDTLDEYPVTNIDEMAFYNHTRLTTVNIPDSVTSIGDCAFAVCEALTSITIPYSVKSIGDDAFY
jgi:hypothetical protein